MNKRHLQLIARLAQDLSAWAVMTALRGPDVEGSTLLKYVTTSVLRHFAGIRPSLNSIVGSPEEGRVLWAGASKEEQATACRQWRSSLHFRQHIWNAFAAIDGEAEEYCDWLTGVLNDRHPASNQPKDNDDA